MSVQLETYNLDIRTGIQYLSYTDGSSIWRVGLRNSSVCWDVALTPTGFNGAEDTDWECVFSIPKT
jgi:hypothetical protein